MFYHFKTIVKDIEYNLYGKGKLPCKLIEHFGHHRPNSTYNYLYKQEIIPKDEKDR